MDSNERSTAKATERENLAADESKTNAFPMYNFILFYLLLISIQIDFKLIQKGKCGNLITTYNQDTRSNNLNYFTQYCLN